MNHFRLVCALLIPTLLALGCAVSQETATTRLPPEEQWVGQLNARDAQPHTGTYLLTLSHSPAGLEGEYTMESDRCVDHGQVRWARLGTDLQAVVTHGSSRMELRVAVSGESFFGTYRFTSGPCQGDWGSTMAQRGAVPE